MPLADVWGEQRRKPIRRSSHSGVSRKLGFHLKLSEKGRRSLQCSPTEYRSGTLLPILASLRLPNPRSERGSYPFSDSFFTEFSEVRYPQAPPKQHQR
jgi:hypothetical protein